MYILDDTFYVTLSSNVEVDYLHTNTQLNFSNKLSKPLLFNPDENWGVSLFYLSIDGDFIPCIENNIIEVSCPQIKTTFSDDRILSVHAIETCNKNHIFESVRNKIFPLKYQTYNYLSISLQGVGNTSLSLGSNNIVGEPTIVVLKFQKMSDIDKKTNIFHLSSRPRPEHKGLLWENEGNAFKCLFPSIMAFKQGDWEVALSSFSYNPCFSILPYKTSNEMMHIYYDPLDNEIRAKREVVYQSAGNTVVNVENSIPSMETNEVEDNSIISKLEDFPSSMRPQQEEEINVIPNFQNDPNKNIFFSNVDREEKTRPENEANENQVNISNNLLSSSPILSSNGIGGNIGQEAQISNQLLPQKNLDQEVQISNQIPTQQLPQQNPDQEVEISNQIPTQRDPENEVVIANQIPSQQDPENEVVIVENHIRGVPDNAHRSILSFEVKKFNERNEQGTEIVVNSIIAILNHIVNKEKRKVLRASYNKEQNRISIVFLEGGTLYLPWELALIIGINILPYPGNSHVKVGSYMPGEIKLCVPFRKDLFVPKDIMLYADFIRPSFIGNVEGCLLKTIPVTKHTTTETECITYEPYNLEYHDLKFYDNNALPFQLLTTSGNAISFLNKKTPIELSLIFRKK